MDTHNPKGVTCTPVSWEGISFLMEGDRVDGKGRVDFDTCRGPNEAPPPPAHGRRRVLNAPYSSRPFPKFPRQKKRPAIRRIPFTAVIFAGESFCSIIRERRLRDRALRAPPHGRMCSGFVPRERLSPGHGRPTYYT
ncbi:hypothetical protein EVAR_103954_1 [Eumeta japonica]|uniref:Uncharacterized protein n=1 Tax=Eumeta variegata TaxID=151549 RepID=A0A4C1YFU6_EUMVA|nr:hypothetical protein EVAR_103954_1 [Eumeta japonica]